MFSALFAFLGRFWNSWNTNIYFAFFIEKKNEKSLKCYTVAKKKTTLEKKHEWTNNSQQHCVIQIVIEKLAVHSKSQERAKKSLIFGRGKTSMIHEFGHAKCNREIVLDYFL